MADPDPDIGSGSGSNPWGQQVTPRICGNKAATTRVQAEQMQWWSSEVAVWRVLRPNLDPAGSTLTHANPYELVQYNAQRTWRISLVPGDEMGLHQGIQGRGKMDSYCCSSGCDAAGSGCACRMTPAIMWAEAECMEWRLWLVHRVWWGGCECKCSGGGGACTHKCIACSSWLSSCRPVTAVSGPARGESASAVHTAAAPAAVGYMVTAGPSLSAAVPALAVVAAAAELMLHPHLLVSALIQTLLHGASSGVGRSKAHRGNFRASASRVFFLGPMGGLLEYLVHSRGVFTSRRSIYSAKKRWRELCISGECAREKVMNHADHHNFPNSHMASLSSNTLEPFVPDIMLTSDEKLCLVVDHSRDGSGG
ncbi:hypothetical protein DFH08DRAFT_804074 [Mycena albidolilacea]|uniref:Uncharacterized protein n=1 Tax=Mycena albidolilacea TaxID=1033008 RepID=A0AAD7AB77_9AGAR|nr:hypothetical protein DFH08DRAFT_804074 [Mycena albidolilacea]